MSPALKKLRYRRGMRVAVIGAPAGFEAELASEPKIVRADQREKNLALVQAFFTRRSHLERSLTRLKSLLGRRGILWVCYPKGGALGTDLNRDIVRESAKAAGLEAVAIVAIDPVWSGLRLRVIERS